MDERGSIAGQLECNRASRGVANDVRLPDSQLRQQDGTVSGLLLDAHRPGPTAVAEAPTVIADERIGAQRRLAHEWQECAGHQASVDEDNWLTRALYLIFELDIANRRPLHG